jgi:hypothetical protein
LLPPRERSNENARYGFEAMAEVIEFISTFVREYPWVVLGIMLLGVVYLVLDREMTFLCPADESVMKRIDAESFRCNRCGFVKKV